RVREHHPVDKRLRGEVPAAGRIARVRITAHREKRPPVRGEDQGVDKAELAGPLDIQAACLLAGRRVEEEDFALVQGDGEPAAVGGKREKNRLLGELADGGNSL